VLLTPAIWPRIAEDFSHGIHSHAGGWLPNWVAEKEVTAEGDRVEAGSILLLDGPGIEKAKRRRLQRGKRISAKLVAAIVPKPLPVTGWALPNEADPDRPEGGAKSTHLAVPAGAVYYFEADSETDAKNLAFALNWHGAGVGREIGNRRSTLMGEKGFGLGVCGTWEFFSEGAK
jgi:CRISPR-associated protein Cmr3